MGEIENECAFQSLRERQRSPKKRSIFLILNEGTCESFLKNLKDTDEAGKPLDYETVENLCFIRFNGPNPLMAKTLIRGELNKHVQKKAWHFITDSHKYFISATVSRQLKAAREEFSLFD